MIHKTTNNVFLHPFCASVLCIQTFMHPFLCIHLFHPKDPTSFVHPILHPKNGLDKNGCKNLHPKSCIQNDSTNSVHPVLHPKNGLDKNGCKNLHPISCIQNDSTTNFASSGCTAMDVQMSNPVPRRRRMIILLDLKRQIVSTRDTTPETVPNFTKCK